MRKSIICIIELLVSITLWATETNWIEDVVQQKAIIRNALQKVNMPICSPLIQVGDSAIPFSANIKGMRKLVLLTEGGADGTDWDWGIWADAKLIREDGAFIVLD